MKRRKLLLGLLGTSGAGLLGCGPEAIPDRRRELMRSWGTQFLLARYRDTGLLIDELDDAAGALEDSPDDARLDAARSAWSRARRPWKEAEVFEFGPAEEEPLRYGPKIDFWPARPSEVDAVLSGSDPIVADDLGAAAKGFPAIEYLLFDEGALEAFQTDPRRHEYLQLLVSDLGRQLDGLRDAWDPDEGDYLSELVDAGGSSKTYDTLSMALSEMVNRMGFLVETIRADKLDAGIAANGTPQPDKLESRFSGRSVEDIEDNLKGVELLYFGDEEGGILSLDDYLKHRGHQLAHAMRSALDSSRRAVGELDSPLSLAIQDDQPNVEHAIETLAELQRLIQVDVLGALSLSVRFSANDGD